MLFVYGKELIILFARIIIYEVNLNLLHHSKSFKSQPLTESYEIADSSLGSEIFKRKSGDRYFTISM